MVKKEENVPEEIKPLQEDNIKTKMRTFAEVVKLKMEQLEDLATLEIMLPVTVRLRKRLESIRKMSKARSLKINGHWKTTNPKMFIANLTGRKLNNNEAEIRFGVYETDKKGDKVYYPQFTPVTLKDGTVIQQETNGQYRISHEVVEHILFRKVITREIIRMPEVPK